MEKKVIIKLLAQVKAKRISNFCSRDYSFQTESRYMAITAHDFRDAVVHTF